MPTNCKGQDKPGQSRGYQAARDTDRGARGSPGGRGHGAGRGLRCCLHPAPHRPPNPVYPQAASTEQQPEPGAPAAHGASTSPRLTASYMCMGVTGSGSRMAATPRAGGDNRGRSQAGFGLCGRAAAKPALECKCGSPALPLRCHPDQPPREPQPSPSTPPGHGLPLPALCHGPQAQQRGQPWGHQVPESLGLPAPWGCSWLSPPMLKHEAVSLNVAIWAALVPRVHSRPGGGRLGCASLWDTPKPGRPQSPALQPRRAWRTRCRRAKGCQTPVKITLSGCPSHFPKH